MTLRSRATAAAVAALLAAVVGCSAHPVTSPSASGPGSPGTYPRTVTLGHAQVTLASPAERVVALSPDVADVAMALVGTKHLAAVPELNKRPEQSVHAAVAQQVPQTIATTGSIDPEKVLAFRPDLVLLTTRHGAEQDALKQLTAAGIAVLAVDNNWDSPEVYTSNVDAIARALGAEDKGRALMDDYRARYARVTDRVTGVQPRPTAATLRILGPNTWINGPTTIGYRILSDAGATNMADILGLASSTKLDNEQLVKVNPQWLVVVDSNGQGRQQYQALLNNPGLASVDAIAQDHICVITSADLASGTGGITALEKTAQCLHPEAGK